MFADVRKKINLPHFQALSDKIKNILIILLLYNKLIIYLPINLKQTLKNNAMTTEQLQQEIESQREAINAITPEQYEAMIMGGQFNDIDIISEFHAQDAQNKAFEVRNQ